ncbi:MAG: glycosyl transferase [Micavibrio sp.]|nr:MAG: glycosyl transferase [Micavibrio sp.]
MRLLIITDAWHPQINGVVRTYEHLIKELETIGHQIEVISPTDFPLRIPLPGYSEIKLALAPSRRLKKMIEAHTPETIHIATEGPLGWAARKYCVKNNLNFSTCYHSHFPDYFAKRVASFLPFLYDHVHEGTKKLVRRFHASAQTMMIATQSLEDELKSWDFKTPMLRLSRGVDLDLFSPGEKTLFHDLPEPVALYVGRIAIEKSIEDFLKMEWDGSKVVVGDGPIRAKLSRKYPDVHFVGAKQGEALAAHYRSADVFVFPSRTDTFGMVQIEALACGLPVAGYNVRGPQDIITEPFLGVLGDNLSDAAHKALKTGTKIQRNEHIQKHYSWENVAQQFTKAMIPVK